MNRRILALAVALLFVLLCGCKAKNNENRLPDVPETVENDVTPTENKATEGELKVLVDANLYVFGNILEAGYLPYEEKSENGLHKVVGSQFSTVGDIKEYLLNVYTADVVTKLMVNVNELYKDVNGELYIDEKYMAGRGYYVDWTDYKIETVTDDGVTCNFKVTATLFEPGEETKGTPYVKELTALRIDDGWRLNQYFR